MAIYKDGEKWRVVFRYTDWRGERKQTQKRGFKTKREAQAWERQEQLRTSGKLDMTFKSFCSLYERDRKQRIKENTWSSKEPVIRTKIMPYFAKRKIHDIEAKDIIQWQNELLALTPADFDFEKKTLTISKSYQRLQGKDIITTPKTLKSNRIIVIPDFLCHQ